MNKILEIKNLSIDYINNHSSKKILDDINIDLYKGETLGIVGESGSGKTITGLAIAGLLDKKVFSVSAGKIILENKDINLLDEESLIRYRGREISMIFQEPMLSLNPVQTIFQQLSEMIKLHITRDSNQVNEICEEIITKVGLNKVSKILKSYPHMISGGQRQRCMIALALVCKPKIIIADEPTTALDVTLQKQILELLNDLKKESNTSLIIISHDLDLIKNYTDHVLIMKDGIEIEYNSTEDIFNNAKHQYTKELINSKPIRLLRNAPLDDELLKINNLHCKYLTKNSFFESNKKYFNALKNIDITLNQGETIGIVGESGSGKTTLAMAILQLLRYEGEITFLGKNLNECTDSELRKIRNQFQIVFQDPYSSLSPRMTIRQILSEGIVEYENISSSKLNERCELLIKEVGLDPIMLDRYPHQFSGGQRQRIAIARALSLRPKMIIFDEPTSALDVIVQKNILDLIVSLQEKYSISYVFITHDLKVIRAISHRTYVLRDAEIVESNLTEDLLSSPSNEYTKKLIDSSFID